jgi:hypothetical protein
VENFIKELKDGFGMNWMPCGEIEALPGSGQAGIPCPSGGAEVGYFCR